MMMEFVSMKVALLDWYDREDRGANFLCEDDVDRCATERILRNKFYDPLVSSDSEDDTPNNIDWDKIFNNNKQQKFKYIIACLRPMPPYPRVSQLTPYQHKQFLKILSHENPDVLADLHLGKPTRQDFKDFEAANEIYLKEQKDYKEWAKSLWVNDHCIRALRPKPAVEQVYEAEFKVKAQRVQTLPRHYDLAAQISLESQTNNCDAVLKEDLIKVSLAEIPQVQIPDKIENQINIITPYALPEPCQKHPYQIVLPNEEALSMLPITEIHRELATFALNNGTKYIASENALKCLTQWNRHWLLPISVCDTIGPDGKTVNVMVLDSEFSVHKEAAHMRSYKAFRHLLENALIPSSEREKIGKITRRRVINLKKDVPKGPTKRPLQDVDVSSDEEDDLLFIDTGDNVCLADLILAGEGSPKSGIASPPLSPRSGFASPKAGFASPSTRLSPEAGFASPSYNLRSPKAGFTSPSTRLLSPEAGFASPSYNLRSPKEGFAPPSYNLRSPKAGFASPTANLRSPEAGLSPPSYNLRSPKAGFASPTACLRSPDAGFAPPTASLRSPKAGFASPTANLRSPEAGFAPPSNNLRSPKAGFASSSASIFSPKAGFAPPSTILRSPKAGYAPTSPILSSPKAGFATPNASLGSQAQQSMRGNTEVTPRRTTRLSVQERNGHHTTSSSKLGEKCPVVSNGNVSRSVTRNLSEECPDIGVYSCTCKGTLYEKPPRRSYKKWQFRREGNKEKLDIIVHSPHKARDKTEELILEPLLEYQIDLGASEQTADAVRSAALSLALRKKASLLNVRVDGPTGDVVTFERLSSEKFADRHPHVTRQVLSSIHTVLSQLQGLRPDHYVLQHEPSHAANAMLMCSRTPQQRHSLFLNFDSGQRIVVDEAHMAKMPPTISTALLPYHKHRRVLPCAFTPYEDKVMKETKKPAPPSKKKAPPQALKLQADAQGTQEPRQKVSKGFSNKFNTLAEKNGG